MGRHSEYKTDIEVVESWMKNLMARGRETTLKKAADRVRIPMVELRDLVMNSDSMTLVPPLGFGAPMGEHLIRPKKEQE